MNKIQILERDYLSDAIAGADTHTLRMWYRNATVTSMQCFGHQKSHWNTVYANEYAAELANRGVRSLNRSREADQGTYNGEGSY